MDMRNYKYLKYILKHKWYVFLAGISLGAPLWALIIHDWQKFTFSEWTPYMKYFMRPEQDPSELKDERLKKDFEKAWLHHIHYGPHHWEYWLLHKKGGGYFKTIEMPDRYRKEMLADWIGAGKAITGFDNTPQWYEENKDKIKLHPTTRIWVEEQLGIFYL